MFRLCFSPEAPRTPKAVLPGRRRAGPGRGQAGPAQLQPQPRRPGPGSTRPAARPPRVKARDCFWGVTACSPDNTCQGPWGPPCPEATRLSCSAQATGTRGSLGARVRGHLHTCAYQVSCQETAKVVLPPQPRELWTWTCWSRQLDGPHKAQAHRQPPGVCVCAQGARRLRPLLPWTRPGWRDPHAGSEVPAAKSARDGAHGAASSSSETSCRPPCHDLLLLLPPVLRAGADTHRG